jgi:hypothetical protein
MLFSFRFPQRVVDNKENALGVRAEAYSGDDPARGAAQLYCKPLVELNPL